MQIRMCEGGVPVGSDKRGGGGGRGVPSGVPS